MEAQPKRRRLPALLERVTTKVSSKTNLGLSDDSPSSRKAEVDHEHAQDEKRESRLGRLGRGIRRWRAKRRKSHGELQRMPHAPFPQKLTPSEESVSVHDGPPQTQEIVSQETSTDPTALQEKSIEKTTPEENIETPEPATQKEITPKQKVPESTAQKDGRTQKDPQPKAIVPFETIQNEALQRQHLPRAVIPAEKEDIPEPIITLPTGYSPLVWSEIAPQVKVTKDRVVVFMRARRHAYEFARSISEDGRAYWTDASHRYLKFPGEDSSHHGGIAVAHRLSKSQWKIYSAHVTGLSNTSDLEKLAILLALQRAVRDREAELRGNQNDMDERPVFKVCSDSLSALAWIEKAISLGIAIRRAAHKLEGTADDANDLNGLLTLSAELELSGVYRFDDYTCPEKTFTASIGRRVLEDYYKLRKLGLVEFHWVPAHTGLLGNEIADEAASIACLWYAKAAPRLGQGIGLVMPLRVLESRGRLQPGSRPTDMMALQTLEGAKDLWTVLMVEGSKRPTMVQSANQVRTITSPGDVQSMKHVLPPPTSCANGIIDSGMVSMSTTVEGWTQRHMNQQTDMALQAIYTTNPGLQFVPHEPGLTAEAKISRISRGQGKKNCGIPAHHTTECSDKLSEQKQVKRRCAYCGKTQHDTRECFEMFPEQKQARPKAYRRWAGRAHLEKVSPGAFSLMSRLHPQLKGVSCRADMSQYMLGRAGLGHDLTALPTYRTIKFPVKRPEAEFSDQIASQYRHFLLAKYEWPQ